MPLIKVIVGTTRPERFSPQPAHWIMELSKEHPEATFELIDLAEVNLPFLDEPVPALFGKYSQEHTKAWSKTIDEADGFIFVTGEYNFSVPPPLKNALDFLAAEWRYKPAAFVSYGAGAGGTLAVSHLRIIVANLSMFDLRDQVAFVSYWEHLDENGKLKATDAQTEAAHKLLDNVTFWAKGLEPLRKEALSRKGNI